MSGEVEKYLIAFNEANELHAKLNDTADMIEEVADALRAEPDEALAGIPSDWPAAEALRTVVRSFETASEQVHRLWDLVRRDLRVHLPQPDQIGRVVTDIPDDDD